MNALKKYIITSPAYTGEINVMFGLDGKLLFIDFLKASLTDEQIQFFKEKCPASLIDPGIGAESLLASNFGKSKLNIVQQGYFVTFEQWWTRYNLKRNRERCEKLWSKMSEADKAAAFFKLGMYERHLSLETWRTKAEPDTYLRNRYWDNDWK